MTSVIPTPNSFSDDDLGLYPPDDYDDGGEWQDPDACTWCGETMLDDMEVGQGYCATAPCWMWANGQVELAIAWRDAQRESARQYAPLPKNRGRRLLWPPRGERGYNAA